ncbi:hypothetical protein NEMBOFW57_002736 [Staphylotrichum longicolle]|uniref:Uncharacterized protein n=1 Tax=Staphylotrichum longicolle TaxID=669026 RepID=A0AAD4I511_9PEZI|nr:hypothetical protein NEMBOFW57_002736 [Staphylotrichum longicolle]
MSDDDQKVGAIQGFIDEANTIQTPKPVRIADLLLKKQLPIMVRPRDSQETQSSLEGNVNEDSMGSSSSSRLPTSQSSSRRGTQLVNCTALQSPPATPPPAPVSRTGTQLINGIGCRFPTGLLSRASTLTVDGESVTDNLAAGRDVLDPRSSPSVLQEDLLNTPRAEACIRPAPRKYLRQSSPLDATPYSESQTELVSSIRSSPGQTTES